MTVVLFVVLAGPGPGPVALVAAPVAVPVFHHAAAVASADFAATTRSSEVTIHHQ